MFIVLDGTGLHCMIGTDGSVESCEPESFQGNHYNED